MQREDSYVPPRGGGTFAVRTIKAIGGAVGRLQFQQGHEKKHALPALVKLFLLLVTILFLSLSHGRLVMLAYTALLLAYLATWPPRDIGSVLAAAMAAAALTLVLVLPAMFLRPEGVFGSLRLVWKVFLSVVMVSIFNHTTQWNHITGALRTLRVPGIFIFTLDITLKYIVLLGRFISDVLTAYIHRAVGNNNKKYQSVGGVMGLTFLRGTEMSREMYEAMRCRGFTDDYKGL